MAEWLKQPVANWYDPLKVAKVRIFLDPPFFIILINKRSLGRAVMHLLGK